MKLLEKKKISSDFATQKKAQIDEGVAIARKVDVLRETLVSLEKQHRDFIANTRQDLINATQKLGQDKERLEGEIRNLEERRKELSKPLNDEWDQLNEAQEKYEKEKDSLKVLSEDIHERESTLKKTEEIIQESERQVAIFKDNFRRDSEESQKRREEAETILQTAENARVSQNADFDRIRTELVTEARANNSQRAFNEFTKKTLDAREKQLSAREKKINDKYNTLLRTINRLKK